MTAFERQIEALLERAWQGASPTAGDLDRVEALVRARVATPNGSGAAGAAGSSGTGVAPGRAYCHRPRRQPNERDCSAGAR
jgi:hypothetical protein